MSKFLQIALITLALQPFPALAQYQYRQPITGTNSGDLPCHMITSIGNTLDLSKLCGGTPQVTPVNPVNAGLVISNIEFRDVTRVQREVFGWAKLMTGTITNQSSRPITARVINYNITAFNGRYREVVTSNSEFLLDATPVTLQPGQSIRLIHSLNEAQMSSMKRYILSPDIFNFEVQGTTMRFIDKVPAYKLL